MSMEHMDVLARRNAERLKATVADLMDEGQDILRSKLTEAVEIFQSTREQAADSAVKAMKKARGQAQTSLVEFEELAGNRPLATAAVALGIGVLIGLAFYIRAPKAVITAKPADDKAAKPAVKAAAAPRAPRTRPARAKAPAKSPSKAEPATKH